MKNKQAIIITSIQAPTASVKRLAELRPDWSFIVVGDRKTPADWQWPGVDFLSFEAQQSMGAAPLDQFASLLPANHYARKNLGYLQAIRNGAEVIYETDDDNLPYDTLLASLNRQVAGPFHEHQGWVNVYRHFTDVRVWPRGFPLEYINDSFAGTPAIASERQFSCPVQQFLADGDPDVDAVFRLTQTGAIKFGKGDVILGTGSYCPFNSQNTVWWHEAFPLLYLPSHVSFRMTDIWRSFIAQICLYRAGLPLAFREATVFQDRNAHDLLRDFRDEVSGYLNNRRIIAALEALPLSEAPEHMGENMRLCYQQLFTDGLVPEAELALVDGWLAALGSMHAVI